MWLLVVAAGSGYLARCLQSSSCSSSNQSKRPRLIDHGDKERDSSSSRSPPRELAAAREYSVVSDEALRVRDRFERLGRQDGSSTADPEGVDRAWKTTPESSKLVSEGGLVTLTSFQKGVHDGGGSKSKNKNKGWPAWPKVQSKIQDGTRTLNGFPDETIEIEERNAEKSEKEVPIDAGESLMKTSLGDVSARKRDAATSVSLEELGDLPSILDWASMAAAQKHNMFVPPEADLATWRTRRVPDRRSRGMSRSRDPSVPATPGLQSVSSPLVMLPTPRKRKAANAGSNLCESSVKEVLLFAMGIHAALVFMRLYTENRSKQLAVSSQQVRTLEDDNESMTSVVTVEPKTDEMAVLEAELAAELEIMELNLSAGRSKRTDAHASNLSSSAGSLQDGFIEIFDDGSSPPQNQQWAVSPRELDRRLHIVLEERQAQHIQELEMQLKEAERKLQMKDVELRSWKHRVHRLSEDPLNSPTDMDDSPTPHRSASSRANSRRRWFPEDREGSSRDDDSYKSSRAVNHLPSLVSAMSSCYISNNNNNKHQEQSDPMEHDRGMRNSFAVDHAGPISRSSVTVSDITGRNGNFNPFYAAKQPFSSSSGVFSPTDAEADSQIHEKMVQWNSAKLPYAYQQQSQVIRTVETIEERRYQRTRCQASLEREEKWLAKRGKSRHAATNNLLYRSQRPRRRWFS